MLASLTDQKKSVSELTASTSKMSNTGTLSISCTPATATATDADVYEPPKKAAALASSTASSNKCSLKKKKSNTTEDDNQLFNSWLSSEIEKNSVKIDLMKTQIETNFAKKQLIDLLKFKASLDIQTLSNPVSVLDSVMFDSEK